VVFKVKVPLKAPAAVGVARSVTLQVAALARVALLQASLVIAKMLLGVTEAAPMVTLAPELLVKVMVLVVFEPVLTLGSATEEEGTLSFCVEVPVRLTEVVLAKPPIVTCRPRLP
jgi:hypothetical protein